MKEELEKAECLKKEIINSSTSASSSPTNYCNNDSFNTTAAVSANHNLRANAQVLTCEAVEKEELNKSMSAVDIKSEPPCPQELSENSYAKSEVSCKEENERDSSVKVENNSPLNINHQKFIMDKTVKCEFTVGGTLLKMYAISFVVKVLLK